MIIGIDQFPNQIKVNKIVRIIVRSRKDIHSSVAQLDHCTMFSFKGHVLSCLKWHSINCNIHYINYYMSRSFCLCKLKCFSWARITLIHTIRGANINALFVYAG